MAENRFTMFYINEDYNIMSNFKHFAVAVNNKFQTMTKGNLFESSAFGDAIFEEYLNAFPEGTNPIYRERTEHDCSCCKNFIRNIGKVVSIDPNTLKVDTVWNIEGLDYPYDVVAKKLHDFVSQHTISSIFVTSESRYGAEHTFEDEKKWNHFWAAIPSKFVNRKVGELKGSAESAHGVLVRSLKTLSLDAIDQVIELIDNKALYRGEEHLRSVQSFKKLLTNLKKHDVVNFAWVHVNDQASRFKNTVIGTLVEDLSNGVDLEDAVRMFESKVAPANYKRPKALITPRMVEDAMNKIRELDLEDALQRRFAKISDVSVNNVIWVDNKVKPMMKDGIESMLMGEAKKMTGKKIDLKGGIPIGIDVFMATVVPKAKSMTALFSNDVLTNLVSITAPVNENAKPLFKWDNGFGWSYNGNIADSDIKKRVKDAGGNVTNAQLRVSLSWFNTDDLDIHIYSNQSHIYYGNKHALGGFLDVDMNAFSSLRTDPVENVSWINVPNGVYRIVVNNYRRRNSTNVGFVVEIENDGNVNQYSYTKPLSDSQNVEVGKITVKDGVITKYDMNIDGTSTQSKEMWGLTTNDFVSVKTIMFSPNHWDDKAVGNKHWFFILDNCLNDEPTRGIYNEFLKSELDKHRKVFEILGDKTKVEPSNEQLSGLGFSSTIKDRTLFVSVVDDKTTKLYNISFA